MINKLYIPCFHFWNIKYFYIQKFSITPMNRMVRNKTYTHTHLYLKMWVLIFLSFFFQLTEMKDSFRPLILKGFSYAWELARTHKNIKSVFFSSSFWFIMDIRKSCQKKIIIINKYYIVNWAISKALPFFYKIQLISFHYLIIIYILYLPMEKEREGFL